ncbi:protein MODIFIER OF SNC1 1-like [Rutidosis leptorrhynchoides]|uniref:protein MODIFIER OF SNC1 1-like n=1 Tax=Rutidosis leptorrhynchoides TaxID=125765 RepID=UPI003A9A1992
MTSSMLAGERRWAHARRGGMTVLGKVAVPKPINLPSQKLENHGLDPNVEIVPKGSLSWGSRPSSSTSNPWGSSASPTADGRPSSGGGLSRPSTAGSDKHEPSTTTWGPNSRPTSASGVMTSSNQSSLTSSRPLSAETRPGSSHLSRFAEPAYDHNAWGPNVNADKLTIPSKANDFSLSSGDFPTLGSEKDNNGKGIEPHDHGSHVRPGSGSGRTAPAKDRNMMAQDRNSGTVDTWTRDGSQHFEDVGRPSDMWQPGDPQQYINPNILPPHFDPWRGPPMNAPPGGGWYRGPPPPTPPAGPPYPPVSHPHGGYPMEPYPYYRSQIPPNLANQQPGPVPGPGPGPGPRGHHPRNGDFYRSQMSPEAFMRPNMPMRPGYYPGPVPYDGYYGPPIGYNPNDQFMGMPPGPPPGPHGPPVYNMGPHQNPSEFHDPHFRGNVRGPVGNIHVSEQLDSVPHDESRGPYKVLRKRDNERDVNIEGGDNWDQNLEHNDQTRPSFHKNERGPHKPRSSTEIWGNKLSSLQETSHEIQTNQKDPILIQKIEDYNEVRASDVGRDPEQKNRLLVHSDNNPTIAFGTICEAGDLNISRQSHHVVRSRTDYQNKGRLNNQDNTDGTSESLNSMVDRDDGQAQIARMREIVKQRAIQRQKEEEERIKEQKAKSHAKLEELDRRKLATSDGTTHNAEKTTTNVTEQDDVDAFTKPDLPSCGLDTKAQVVDQTGEKSQQGLVDQPSYTNQSVVNTDDGSLHRQKRASHRQKQSVQTVESVVDKSTIGGGTGEAHKVPSGVFIKDSSSNVTVSVESVSHQEDNLNILSSELTQNRKKNNKINKNKHKSDDVSVSKDGDFAKKTPHSNNEEALDRVPNQYKPQHSRRMLKNPQANRPVDKFHVGDVAVWAPVRAPNKEEQDDVPLSANNNNSGQNNNLKSKRAEIERYVPKPVAKELAQQETVNPSDEPAICVSANVGPTVESKGHNNKQNKPMKPYGAQKQHDQSFQQDAKNNNNNNYNNPVPTETKVVEHEWDPDGWCMPDEPPTEVTSGVKDDGGKGKRPAYKGGQKNTMKSNNVDYNKDFSGAEFEIEQTDRPTSSKESRWQSKPHGYRGGQNASSEVKRVRPEEPVDEYYKTGRETIRKERKPGAYRQQDEASFEQQHGSTGFRKYGGQGQNNLPVGQDDRRKHNNQHNVNVNRERPRQNLHYEYQPVGSNNKPSNPVAPTDGFGNAGPRYKERGSGSGSGSGSGHPRRGGGTFNGRQ